MINLQNGNFQITDKIVIGTEKKYDDILKLMPTNKTLDLGNGYKWIYFIDIEIGNHLFYISICFYNDSLFCINFSFRGKQEKKMTWDNYNEKDELKRKEIYNKWLTKIIGQKRSFEWGKVDAFFDPKGGTTGIYISYE